MNLAKPINITKCLRLHHVASSSCVIVDILSVDERCAWKIARLFHQTPNCQPRDKLSSRKLYTLNRVHQREFVTKNLPRFPPKPVLVNTKHTPTPNYTIYYSHSMKRRSSTTFSEESCDDETKWVHPATRTEIAGDSELRSLITEMAADFGRTEPDKQERKTGNGEATTCTTSTDDQDGGGVAMPTTQNVQSQQVEKKSSLGATPAHGEPPFVFNIDDITDLLRQENAQDICVIKIPPEKNYVDYFVVVTGRSSRHLSAMTQYINKQYKMKKRKSDPFVIIEGKLADDWICIDFGNIVVHFMLDETRAFYDLETLWLFGKEFDDQLRNWQHHKILLFNEETDDVQRGSFSKDENEDRH